MTRDKSMSPAEGDRDLHAQTQGAMAALSLLGVLLEEGDALSAGEASALMCDELSGLIIDSAGDSKALFQMLAGFSGPISEAARVAVKVVAFLKLGTAVPGAGGTVQ